MILDSNYPRLLSSISDVIDIQTSTVTCHANLTFTHCTNFAFMTKKKHCKICLVAMTTIGSCTNFLVVLAIKHSTFLIGC